MPRCKECNDKFKPKYFLQKFCLEKDECIKAHATYAKDQEYTRQKKDWTKRKEELKPEAYKVDYKKAFQAEINKLSRMIDNSFGFGCISCGTKKNVQFAGGHRFSVGSNTATRYNLHNVHKQCNKNCNKHLGGNPAEYDKGLIERHGNDYKALVHGLGLKYAYIGLKSAEYPGLIKTTRKIVRDFETFKFKNAIQARDQLNKLIGIYQ